MKEKPILFGTWAIPKLLDGTKTQTRRVLKLNGEIPKLSIPDDMFKANMAKCPDLCPYGVGQRLWVRETWATNGAYNRYRPNSLPFAFTQFELSDPKIFYKASEGYPHQFTWRPSIFMPRWASRIAFEITEVRVERVAEISNEDARAEGCQLMVGTTTGGGMGLASERYVFKELWDSLNAKRGYGWEVNPWVWVIAFKEMPC